MLERTLSEGMITLSAYFSTFLVITFLSYISYDYTFYISADLAAKAQPC